MENMANNSSNAPYEQVDILENEELIKLKDPTVDKFGNTGKDINTLRTTFSYNVVDQYKRSV